MDIPVDQPLPVGFFKKKERRFKIWIQFKFERLPDFCYRCGRLDHITGRCTFSELATIKTRNGIVAKLYGPWIRARVAGSLSFANPTITGARCQDVVTEVEAFRLAESRDSNSFLFGEIVGRELEAEKAEAPLNSTEGFDKLDKKDYFNSILALCPEVEALSLTINKHFLMDVMDLQSIVLEKVIKYHLDLPQIRCWA